MGSYELAATLLVLAIPLAAIGLVAGAVAWGRDSIDRAPVTGGVGVVCTVLATANTLVERACGGEVNRAAITAFIGPEGCRPGALAALAAVLLLALATALVARAPELRRWLPPGGPAPDGGAGSIAAR